MHLRSQLPQLADVPSSYKPQTRFVAPEEQNICRGGISQNQTRWREVLKWFF